MDLQPVIKRQTLAMYLRVHLAGASAGVRLAELLATDPWTDGTINHLPAELHDEAQFARDWAATNSSMPELWTRPIFGATAVARAILAPLHPLRGNVRRATAMEAMRSLVLAKKAMWELGLILETDPHTKAQLARYDSQADRQANELRQLHQRAAAEAFG